MKKGRTLVAGVLLVALLSEPAHAQPRKVRKPRFRHRSTSQAAVLGNVQKLEIKATVELIDAQVEDCHIGVPVRFQKKKGDDWDTIASDKTNSNGVAVVVVPDKTGKYRAVAPLAESEETGFDCFKAVSEPATHSH